MHRLEILNRNEISHSSIKTISYRRLFSSRQNNIQAQLFLTRQQTKFFSTFQLTSHDRRRRRRRCRCWRRIEPINLTGQEEGGKRKG
jgi:hypothetical protein